MNNLEINNYQPNDGVDIWDKIEAAGGMDAYQQQVYREELTYYRQQLIELQQKPPLPEGESYYPDQESIEYSIHKIQLLFSLHQVFTEHGYDQTDLFRDLVFALDYAGSVLGPMEQMVQAGDIEAAWQLFKQPRHIHR